MYYTEKQLELMTYDDLLAQATSACLQNDFEKAWEIHDEDVHKLAELLYKTDKHTALTDGMRCKEKIAKIIQSVE